VRGPDIRPRKDLGQHFLQDQGALAREVAYADLRGGETVLEIGPGPGGLTELLLLRAARVVAIEKDARFRPRLQALQRRCGNLELIWGDALDVDFPSFDKVVANLPFGPALPLTFRLLDQRFDRAVLIYQRRLAERICARVGEKGYCRLGIAIGRRADAELLEVVPPSAFAPPPAVDSAIVMLRRTRPKFPIPSEDFFRQLLEDLFARREAPLEQAVRTLGGLGLAPPALARTLAGLGGKLRGKPVRLVTPREFGQLARALGDAGARIRGG
jgi:16S rRNA (adenine1518-N6/adenine1519-N6)-dimethyltransferase